MASRIVGIDLGAYSVKVVVTNPGFRQAMVTDVIEVKVPEGEESQLVRAASALASVGNRFQSDDDSVFSSIAGDSVFLHVLEFGFKTMRRTDLDRVVGSELEGVLPIDLEDMVYAFEEIPRLTDASPNSDVAVDPDILDLSGSLVGSGTVVDPSSVQRGRIAETATGMRVLAAATQRDRAEELLFALRSEGVDPRGLLATPAPYARLADKLAGQSGRLVAILDIGHKRTDFCLSKGGKPVYARTIARGGEELTRIIARTWKLEMAEAEELKHSSGFIESRREIATSDAARSMSEVLSKQLLPLMREIRRTIQACRAKTGYAVEEIVLVGGGSRLSGMAPYFSEGLRVPVQLLSQENVMSMLGDCAATASLDTCFLALGVATDGASAKPSFDLRQGALAFAGDVSFLRTKVRALATSAVVIMAFGVLAAFAGVSKLRSAEKILKNRVAAESGDTFGKQLDSEGAIAVAANIKKNGSVGPLPKMTAYDMLLAFNAAIPKKEEIVIDVKDIDITPGKIVVKATSSPLGETDALEGIKLLEKSLKDSECFKEFKSPKSNPSSKDSDKRDFTLTIKSDCNKE